MFQPGDILQGRYRVESVLGGGANGTVFRCLDVDLERPCCIKALKVRGGLTAREQLRREAAVLASLRHLHVASVYAFGDHEGTAFFVMEYVEGNALDQLIEEHYGEHQSPIAVRQAVGLLRALCDGVAAVHGAGMIHRDIKPANTIVEQRTGRLVLVDFGAAVLPRRWDGEVTGTPHYMAPEAFGGATPTPQSDLYSLGCLAFELLCGQPPFDAGTLEALRQLHLEAPVPSLSQHRQELTPFEPLFASLLAKEPSRRPASAAVLANQFEDAARTSEPAMAGASEIISTGGLRVLVVDDDPTFARMAARCVQVAMPETLVSVSRAGTRQLAVANAHARRPDLIVLDYQLPDGTGVDVLSDVRAKHGHHTEVLVASGALTQSERWRFHILGVNHFVDKPVDFASLVQLVHEIARRRAWIPASP